MFEIKTWKRLKLRFIVYILKTFGEKMNSFFYFFA